MKKTKFATQIDEQTLKKLKAYAADSERSISGIVNAAVKEYVARSQVRPAFREAMDEVLADNTELLKRLAK